MSTVTYAMRSSASMDTQQPFYRLNSNSLTAQERAAIRRSDRKAEQVLGVTLTRDASMIDTFNTKQDLGVLMARINAKRTRGRQSSNVTLVGALKDFGVKIIGLDKLFMTYGSGRRKRFDRPTHRPPQRVVLSSCASSTSSSPEGSELCSTIDSEEGNAHYDDDEDTDGDRAHLDMLSPVEGGHRMPLAPLSLLPTADQDGYREDEQFSETTPQRPLTPLTFAPMPDILAPDQALNDHCRRYSFLDFGNEHDNLPKLSNTVPSDSSPDPVELEPYRASPESDFLVPEVQGFEWDFRDPFNTPVTDPAYVFFQSHYSKMHLGDNVPPHVLDDSGFAEHFPFAHLSPPPPSPTKCKADVENDTFGVRTPISRVSLSAVGGGDRLPASDRTLSPSPGASCRASSASTPGSSASEDGVSGSSLQDKFSVSLLRADLEYINAVLKAQEAREAREALAEEAARREKRARVRSQLKQLALLGDEAREAIGMAA
ncbi:hypothetical protein ID866_2663 [Astraeus odoratus]|nr:hypothetical protein ID866_2663 [Astraeus odoratus]